MFRFRNRFIALAYRPLNVLAVILNELILFNSLLDFTKIFDEYVIINNILLLHIYDEYEYVIFIIIN